MRRFRALLACLLCAAVLTGTAADAAAGRRVALVVGVARYGAAGDLSSPVHDAERPSTTSPRCCSTRRRRSATTAAA